MGSFEVFVFILPPPKYGVLPTDIEGNIPSSQLVGDEGPLVVTQCKCDVNPPIFYVFLIKVYYLNYYFFYNYNNNYY